jgi:hypothetical protein
MSDTPSTPAAPAPPAVAIRTADGQVLNAPAGQTFQPSQAPESLLPGIPLDQARARLAQIKETPELRDAVLRGSPGAVKEWHDLHRITVAAGDTTVGPGETTSEGNITARERESALDGLRSGGHLPVESEAYIRAMESGAETFRPSQGDALLAREARERFFKDPRTAQSTWLVARKRRPS